MSDFKILDDKNYKLEKATILIDFLNNMNNQNEIECKKDIQNMKEQI